MKLLANFLKAEFREGSKRGELVREAIATTGVKLLAAGIAFISNALFARWMGPSEFGVYSVVLAWVAIATTLAGLGYPQYLVREGAKNFKAIKSLRNSADRRIFAFGGCVGVSIFLISKLSIVQSFSAAIGLSIALPMLTNLYLVRQSLLQSIGRVAQSYLGKFLIVPIATLIIASAIFICNGRITSVELIAISELVAIIVVLFSSFQLVNAIRAVDQSDVAKSSISFVLPFMWLSACYMLVARIGTVILGIYSTSESVGVYSVATKSAEMLAFVGMAAVTTAAPNFSRLYNQGEIEALQRLVTALSRRLFIFTLFPAAVLISFPSQILTILYGPGYEQGAKVLQLLCVAQIIAVTGGPLGTLLSMTGNEGYHLIGVVISLVLNVVLACILIPLLGGEGAALAVCVGMLMSRQILGAFVKRRVGISSSIFGKLTSKF